MDILLDLRNNIAFGLLGVVTAILVILGLLALSNPVLFKLGLRNIPRRPAQSILIVVGLTLSTVIIVASFSTGDTLDYSVRRQAVAAYGQIDEIIAPPLISLFTSISQGDPESAEAVQAQEELDNLFEGGLTSVPAVFEGGVARMMALNDYSRRVPPPPSPRTAWPARSSSQRLFATPPPARVSRLASFSQSMTTTTRPSA